MEELLAASGKILQRKVGGSGVLVQKNSWGNEQPARVHSGGNIRKSLVLKGEHVWETGEQTLNFIFFSGKVVSLHSVLVYRVFRGEIRAGLSYTFSLARFM